MILGELPNSLAKSSCVQSITGRFHFGRRGHLLVVLDRLTIRSVSQIAECPKIDRFCKEVHGTVNVDEKCAATVVAAEVASGIPFRAHASGVDTMNGGRYGPRTHPIHVVAAAIFAFTGNAMRFSNMNRLGSTIRYLAHRDLVRIHIEHARSTRIVAVVEAATVACSVAKRTRTELYRPPMSKSTLGESKKGTTIMLRCWSG